MKKKNEKQEDERGVEKKIDFFRQVGCLTSLLQLIFIFIVAYISFRHRVFVFGIFLSINQ